MNWLGQLIWGLVRGLLGHAQDQAEKPKTITNANTPLSVRERMSAARDKWLRDKKRDSNRQPD